MRGGSNEDGSGKVDGVEGIHEQRVCRSQQFVKYEPHTQQPLVLW